MTDKPTLSNTVDDEPKLGQGNVSITLGDQELVLKPSIWAMQTLSRKYGGIQNVIEALQHLNFDVMVDVVIAGLGNRYNNPKLKNDLMEKLYASGVSDDTGKVVQACGIFVLILLRGGKPLPANLQELMQKQTEATSSEQDEGNLPSSS